MNESAPIVVGINGSQDCVKALRWAAAEAALRGCAVEAVSVSTAAQRATEIQTGLAPLVDSAARIIAAVERDNPSVHIRHLHKIGAPAPVLVRSARGAAMLVVGSREAGPVMRALVGSVGTYCARHADCPVVIVPKDRPAPPANPSTEDFLATPGPLL